MELLSALYLNPCATSLATTPTPAAQLRSALASATHDFFLRFRYRAILACPVAASATSHPIRVLHSRACRPFGRHRGVTSNQQPRRPQAQRTDGPAAPQQEAAAVGACISSLQHCPTIHRRHGLDATRAHAMLLMFKCSSFGPRRVCVCLLTSTPPPLAPARQAARAAQA